METHPHYPDSGPWAVIARAALMLAIAAVMFASLAPVKWVPQPLASRHLEHFAAFYVTTLIAAAALPRTDVIRLGAVLGVLAGLLEVARMAPSQHRIWGVLDWEADFGGILATLAPIVIAQFRSRFAQRPAA